MENGTSNGFKVDQESVRLGSQTDEDHEEKIQRIRDNVKVQEGIEARNVDYYYYDTGIAQSIARNPTFENLTLCIIVLNAFWIGWDANFNDSDVLIKADLEFIIMENFFCAYFTFEWTVRLFSFRRKCDGRKDFWFVFDTFLVAMMVFETWIMSAITLLTPGDGNGVGPLSVLRIARLLRLTRMARLARACPEMVIMIRALISAMRSVTIALLLLFLMIYVFAIAFVQLLDKDSELKAELFSTVEASILTLIIEGVFPDQGGTLKALGDEAWYLGILFFFFCSFSVLTMVNMLIGILCEVVSDISKRETEAMDIDFVRGKILHVMDTDIDKNGDHMISKTEFLDILRNENATKALKTVGVDVHVLLQNVEYIFEDELDEKGVSQPKKLPFLEFMEAVLQCRDSNQATVKDITHLRKYVHGRLNVIESELFGGRLGSSSASRSRSPADPCKGSPQQLNRLPTGKSLVNMSISQEDVLAATMSAPPAPAPPPVAMPGPAPIPIAVTNELQELQGRIGGLERMMEQVVQTQFQIQGLLKERLPARSNRDAYDPQPVQAIPPFSGIHANSGPKTTGPCLWTGSCSDVKKADGAGAQGLTTHM